jgi:hypothetical protein
MATARTTQHPYLDIFTASLVPRMTHGTGHAEDPPPLHLLPLPTNMPEAQQLLDLLLGADRDIRGDHARAAAINLAVAETRLRLAISHDGLTPALEAARAAIALAREEVAGGNTRRACAALAGAVHTLQRPPGSVRSSPGP